jgi:curved DNA-binding protein CbpA
MADEHDEQLDQLDYYTLLGIEPDADADDIKRAFQRFARKYHPDQYPAPSALADRVSRIYRRGTEAYRILSNPDYRPLYDQALKKGALRLDPGEARMALASAARKDPGSEVGKMYVEMLVRGADKALERDDRELAEHSLSAALQIDPGNDELKKKLKRVKEHLNGKSKG